MKKKKGFTLVELLAVIIVLIIIMLIALNVIRTSTKKAKDNTVRANAIAFIKAVDDMIDGSDNQYEYDGSVIFSIQDLYDKGLKMSGTQPDGGYLSILNGEIVFGCLTYNKFYVNYSNNEVSQPKKGVCKGNINGSFAYTGDEQSFTAAVDGVYKLEVWGAQGGSADNTYVGGYGGYSVGYVNLNKNDTLYINVGGQGLVPTETGTAAGGYNGGGNSYTVTTSCSNACGSGGGATSIATKSGLVSTLNSNDILIIAGGGGGASYRNCSTTDYAFSTGGSSGGYNGSSLFNTNNYWGYTAPKGGTQISGGAGGTSNGESGAVAGSFGHGGQSTRTGGYTCSSGGGGGYYGGGSGMFIGAGGGSSFIGNYKLFNGNMFCYNCSATDIPTFITNSTSCNNEEPTENCAKQGQGFAKITYAGSTESTQDKKYLYSVGNEFKDVTGGWVATNTQGNGRTEKLPNNLHIYCSSTGSSGSRFITSNAIDMSKYKKLHVVYQIANQHVSNTYAYLRINLTGLNYTSPNMVVGYYHEVLDISSINSSQVEFYNWDTDDKIMQVWLAND